MKLDSKPTITMEATLTLSHEELLLLRQLAGTGLAVVEPIIGKNPLPHNSEPWDRLLKGIYRATSEAMARFEAARDVFDGKKVAVPARRAAQRELTDAAQRELAEAVNGEE